MIYSLSLKTRVLVWLVITCFQQAGTCQGETCFQQADTYQGESPSDLFGLTGFGVTVDTVCSLLMPSVPWALAKARSAFHVGLPFRLRIATAKGHGLTGF